VSAAGPLPSAPLETCSSCGAALKAEARFCGSCGQSRAPVQPVAKASSGRGWLLGALTVLAVLLAVAYADVRWRVESEESVRLERIRDLNGAVEGLEQSVAALQAKDAELVRNQTAEVKKQTQGIAPLAAKTLRSVLTVDTPYGGGSGWIAWKQGDATYVITAAHVVEGFDQVKLRRKNLSWNGRVVKTDETNDLALIKVLKPVGPALWQSPQTTIAPVAGDQVIIVGSPYGLEGTVTTGIISRITYNRIQTDAAANPGNSGGPVVNREGLVVGILVAGAPESVNFAIPIQRACVSIRSC